MIQTEILDLHICTELMAGWSGIAMAALGIGGQILEIQMADQLLGGTSFPTASPPATVGGFPFSISGVAGFQGRSWSRTIRQDHAIVRKYASH